MDGAAAAAEQVEQKLGMMEGARHTSILKKQPKYLPRKPVVVAPTFSLASSYLFRDETGQEDRMPVMRKMKNQKADIEKEKIAVGGEIAKFKAEIALPVGADEEEAKEKY